MAGRHKPDFSWRKDEEFLAFLMMESGDSREEVLRYVAGMEHSYTAFKGGQRSVVRVGTAAFIRNADGQVLMGLRKGSHGPGTWSVPGGHVDFGEEPVASVRREIMEETGMEVGTILPCISAPWVNSHFPKSGKQYITLYFLAEHIDQEPRVMEPEKCVEWRWFDLDALPEPLFEPLAYHQILGKLDDRSAWLDSVSSRRG